jgi:transketolase
VVTEDHYPEGGIGSAVLEALNDAGHPARVAHLAVRGLPGSGTSQELMEAAGISAGHVARAARALLGA